MKVLKISINLSEREIKKRKMKNRILITIVVGIVLMMLFSCKKSMPEEAFPSPKKNEKTEKWGFVYDGKTIIKYNFDNADEFSSGLARVELNGKWGFIDKKGNEIIPLKFSSANNFQTDLAIVSLNGRYGVIDITGEEIIPLMYEDIDFFKDNLSKAKLNGKYGYIDMAGKTIIPFIYDSSVDFLVVKSVLFEGGYFEWYESNNFPSYTPSSWRAGKNTFVFELKCTFKEKTKTEVPSDLYEEGEIIAPDGTRYKASTATSRNNKDGLIYDLWFSIPDNIDIETLLFVYKNQVLLLKK